MSRIIDTYSIKKTIKTDFSRKEEEKNAEGNRKFYYDSFAFRDRITNNKFQYKQARKTQDKQISYFDWKNGLQTSKEMKDSLKQYRFTKSFQIDCIRKKYLKQNLLENQDTVNIIVQSQSDEKEDLPRSLSKNTLFQINKQEMRRILESNDSVSPDILELNHAKKYRYTQKHKPMKKGLKRWKFIDHSIKQSDQNLTESIDVENKIAERAINHMKNQIKTNCQYLLNLPIQMKKKALFSQQLRKHKKYYKPVLTHFNHSQLQKCVFSSQKEDQHYYSVEEEEELCLHKNFTSNIMINVKHGFMNQVQLELKNNPNCHFLKDKTGNNIFHLAAKQGNLEMIKLFLNIISPRNCLKLLKQKNNLKRSPLDKASFLGYGEILNTIQEYRKQNKYTS